MDQGSLHVVDWEEFQQQVVWSLNSHFLLHLQTADLQDLLELFGVHHLSEVDGCQPVDEGLDFLQPDCFLFVEGHDEGNSASGVEGFGGDPNSFDWVGHEHEGEAEEDEVKFGVREGIVDVIEVHIVDADVLIGFEDFLGLLSVDWVEVNSHKLIVILRQLRIDLLEGSPRSAADVEERARQASHVGEHGKMGGDSEETADEEVVDEGGEQLHNTQQFAQH